MTKTGYEASTRAGIEAEHAQPPLVETNFQFAYGAWIVALVGALGSLFFGEVMKLPPCTLCWYQRICLFPLVAILAVGIASRDRRMTRYAAPFVLAGLGIALYHNGVQLGWIPETLTPCTGTSSCSERQLELLGFITIPILSASAFAAIGSLLLLHQMQPMQNKADRKLEL